jgi:HSP20 family protein
MAVTRWSPLSDLLAVQSAMDRLFTGNFIQGRGRREALEAVGEGYVPIDVYRTDKEWIVRAAVPGADPNAVEVTCEGNTVTLRGEIKWPDGVKSENYWLRENFYGNFSRLITLPDDARCDDSRAEFLNGMLVAHVPRDTSKAQPKRIPVAAATGSQEGASATSQRPIAASSASRK